MTTDNPSHEPPDSAATPPAAAPPPPPPLPPVESQAPVDDDEPDEVPADEPESANAEEAPPPAAEAPAAEAPAANAKQWYVVKVQSNREESIKAAIERRVKIEGLEESFGQIVIPTEKVSEMRKNKRVIRERKLLHGYLLVNVEFNDRMLYLFRETSGVGDFVGAGVGKKPNPMSENEIKKWIRLPGDESKEAKPDDRVSPFNEGDKVKVKDGMFSGMEGVVKQVLQAKGSVTVELTIFGRPVPVELEYWQVDFA